MIARKLQVCAAMLAVTSMIASPLYAQAPATPAPAPATSQATNSQASAPPPSVTPPMTVSLAPDYSHGPQWFPNVIAPYVKRHIPEPMLTNSPRLSQLIQNGQLNLTIDDAIALALENNLDIAVQRYSPWISEMTLLSARAGSRVNFDPNVTMNLNESDATIAVANPLTAGVGVSNVAPSITQHSTTGNFGYTQGFAPGTEVSMSFNNSRSSSSTSANVFNPSLTSSLSVSVTQPLLNGFGILPNERFIIEDKNNVKSTEWAFKTSVITDISTTETDYWNLVYARQSVTVDQKTVAVDQTLYDNTNKELQIGTVAPLDVLTTESQLAADKQSLIVAQTLQLEDETKLLNDISKNPLDASLRGVEVIPTSPIPNEDAAGNQDLEQAVQQAWADRPEMQQAALQLKNDDIEVKVTTNALLPTLNLVGQYSTTGLGGVGKETTTTKGPLQANLLEPIVDASGAPTGDYVGVNPLIPIVTPVPGGIGDAWNSLIHSRFPTFQIGLTMTLPIRNRAAQGSNGAALLNQRQEETNLQAEKNTIYLAVRNALISVKQDRSAVAAAGVARQLAQQTFDDEQKKYQLGSSDAYTVALRSRDLTNAEGTELLDQVNLVNAVTTLDQALGRTLEVHNISIAEAKNAKPVAIPNIPGSPNQ